MRESQYANDTRLGPVVDRVLPTRGGLNDNGPYGAASDRCGLRKLTDPRDCGVNLTGEIETLSGGNSLVMLHCLLKLACDKRMELMGQHLFLVFGFDASKYFLTGNALNLPRLHFGITPLRLVEPQRI